MLIANTGQSLVVMNLRTGEQVQLPPGQMTPVLDSKIPFIDDSFVLISLFNAGVLVAYTDAGAAYPGFPTTANPADSKRIPPVDADYAAAVVGAAGVNSLKMAFAGFGDSLTLWNNYIAVPTSIVRSGGVAVVTVSQINSTGALFNITGCTPASFNAFHVPVTRLSATTFSYPCPGPDESATSIGNSTNLSFYANNGPVLYAISELGGALQWVKNFGVGGQTSAQILARLPDLIAVGPTGTGEIDAALVTAGSNDATAGIAVEEYAYNMRQIINGIRTAGILPVVPTIPPFAATHPSVAAVQSRVVLYNAWLRKNGARLGAIVPDVFAALTDASNANGAAISGLISASDYTHYTHMGARLAGKKIAAALDPRIKATASVLVTSRNDSYAVSPAMPNIHPFDLGSSSGGSVSDVVTGTVMAGSNVSSTGNAARTVVCSVVASNRSVGNAQRIVMTPAAAGDTVTHQQNSGATMAGRVVPGERYQFKVYVKLSGAAAANLQYIRQRIQGTFDGVSSVQIGGLSNSYTATDFDVDDTFVFVTPPIVIPPFSTCTAFSCELIFGFSAAGTALTAEVEAVSMDRVQA